MWRDLKMIEMTKEKVGLDLVWSYEIQGGSVISDGGGWLDVF